MSATDEQRRDLRQFDVCGALPSGVTVLEASAGTGKTYTIAALAARYVAEGSPLERLLLVTFTRMATGELRDRVRERLVVCEQQLSRDPRRRAPTTAPTTVVTLLAYRAAVDRSQLRRDRLARAVADFDAATIATTHGFCQEVLGGARHGRRSRARDRVRRGRHRICWRRSLDDLYVRRFQRRGGAPFDRDEALEIARAAVFNPTAALEPRGAARGHDRRDALPAGGRGSRRARAAQAADWRS